MLALLPRQNAAVFFANVAVLRQAGMLELLTGGKAAGDTEYENFVRQTHFDYSRDLRAVAGATGEDEIFFVIRGRFDWGRLRAYAAAHGGSCANGVCRAATSRAGRWASFFAIQPDAMALALSTNGSAVKALRPERRHGLEQKPPTEPVWVRVSPSVLRNPTDLPAGLRIFAISLEPANSVVLSMARAAEKNAAFDLRLTADCPSAATAETVRSQLEIQTNMLGLELKRERERPNPADLTGLLTAGSFQVVDKRVIGIWPVRNELLKTLE